MKTFLEIVKEHLASQNIGIVTEKQRQESLQNFQKPIDVPVDSTAINNVAYDPNTKVLEIEFYENSRYRYYNVREAIANEIINADSVGGAFNDYIKGGFFAFTRIN